MENNTNEITEIKSMLKELITLTATPKKWLNSSEVAYYLGYSQESIKKMVKNNQFQEGLHYHKRVKRLIFDRNAIDNRVISSSSAVNNTVTYDTDSCVENILSSITS